MCCNVADFLTSCKHVCSCCNFCLKLSSRRGGDSGDPSDRCCSSTIHDSAAQEPTNCCCCFLWLDALKTWKNLHQMTAGVRWANDGNDWQAIPATFCLMFSAGTQSFIQLLLQLLLQALHLHLQLNVLEHITSVLTDKATTISCQQSLLTTAVK